ncbi:hypothetical protein WG909_05310 [Peptostreptococcaceae bacterium AGR-M142]
MKKTILTLVFIFMLTIFSFASEKEIGNFELSKNEILYNNGLYHVTLPSYMLKIENEYYGGNYIVLDNLFELGYKIDEKNEKEIKISKIKGLKDDSIWMENGKDMEFLKCDQNKINNIKTSISKDNKIYKNDIKLYINGNEISTFSTSNHTLIPLEELKATENKFFYTIEKHTEETKLHKMLIDRFNYTLITEDGTVPELKIFNQVLNSDFSKNIIATNQLNVSLYDNNLGHKKDLMTFKTNSFELMNLDEFALIKNHKNQMIYIYDFDGNKLYEGKAKSANIYNDYLVINGLNNNIVYSTSNNNFKEILSLDSNTIIKDVTQDMIFFKNDKNDIIHIKDFSNNDVTVFEFNDMERFDGGVAKIKINGKCTLIDSNLNRVTQKEFDDFSKSYKDIRIFKENSKEEFALNSYSLGIIDNEGYTLLEPSYNFIKIYDNLDIRVGKTSKDSTLFGLMNLDSKILIPLNYLDIQKKDNKYYAYNLDNYDVYDSNYSKIENIKLEQNIEIQNDSIEFEDTDSNNFVKSIDEIRVYTPFATYKNGDLIIYNTDSFSFPTKIETQDTFDMNNKISFGY